ncbi:hypothetical protein ONZ45_g6829 [Pleurotus djamor]|nr:hypothetical protein ONZ45_g6829 [Pleurotus djamor]
MFSKVILTFALTAISFAYQITSPDGEKGWTDQGCQKVKWNHSKTDPQTFSMFLSNQRTGYKQELASVVDGSKGEMSVCPPSGSWPAGANYRINFAQDAQHESTLRAQSNEFAIEHTEPTSPPAGSDEFHPL